MIRLLRWWHDLRCELRAMQAENRMEARAHGQCICPEGQLGGAIGEHEEWCPAFRYEGAA